MTSPSPPEPHPASWPQPTPGPHPAHRSQQCSQENCHSNHRPKIHQQAKSRPDLIQPGHLEDAVRDLQLTEPALLVRASAIDEAGRELLAEAIAKAHRQASAARASDRPASTSRGPAAAIHHGVLGRVDRKVCPVGPPQQSAIESVHFGAAPSRHRNCHMISSPDRTIAV